MKYEKNTHYWLLGDDKQWQSIFYNVDSKFLVGDLFFTTSQFDLIFKDNKVIKAIMPTDIGILV